MLYIHLFGKYLCIIVHGEGICTIFTIGKQQDTVTGKTIQTKLRERTRVEFENKIDASKNQDSRCLPLTKWEQISKFVPRFPEW